MGIPQLPPDDQDRRKITSRKIVDVNRGPGDVDDSLAVWIHRYLDLAVRGVRSDEVTRKITRHLERFADWFTAGLGHDPGLGRHPARGRRLARPPGRRGQPRP